MRERKKEREREREREREIAALRQLRVYENPVWGILNRGKILAYSYNISLSV